MSHHLAPTITATITSEELKNLITFTHPTCVSLCFPLDPTQPNPQTNSLELKNIFNQALDSLTRAGLTGEIYEMVSQSCEQLLGNTLFWKEPAAGLAVFITSHTTQIYKLSKAPPRLYLINDHYYILPLWAELATQATFYVLELDKEHTQMWEGTERSLTKVTVPNLPMSVAEVTGVEVNERQLQFHTSTSSPGGGTRAAAYHGSSSWKDDHDRYLEKFLQAVDKAILAFPKLQARPVLISGVEEVAVLFRKLSRYPTLTEPTLAKQTDPIHREKNLHQQSWDTISKLIEKERQALKASFDETLPGKKATLLPEIMRQVNQGKVGTLLLQEGVQVWGTFDAKTGDILIDKEQRPLSVELLNQAARLTLSNSGEVVTLPAGEMPSDTKVAAILRY